MLKRSQQGVSMIEVLIALLIIAISAMGYSLLQTRSAKATQDAMQRSYALSILGSLANQIRINTALFGNNSIPQTPTADATNTGFRTDIQIEQDYINTLLKGASGNKCYPLPNAVAGFTACDSAAMVQADAGEALKRAASVNIRLGGNPCPGNAARLCLFAAWDDSLPKMGGEPEACLDSAGNYTAGASCVMMEVY